MNVTVFLLFGFPNVPGYIPPLFCLNQKMIEKKSFNNVVGMDLFTGKSEGNEGQAKFIITTLLLARDIFRRSHVNKISGRAGELAGRSGSYSAESIFSDFWQVGICGATWDIDTVINCCIYVNSIRMDTATWYYLHLGTHTEVYGFEILMQMINQLPARSVWVITL